MQFSVPQFIDVEDKIFGPLTFRQGIYLGGGAGLVFLCLKLLPTFAGILVGLPIAALAFALAFIKVNEKPLINTIEAAFNYGINDKLYIWKQEKKKGKTLEEKKNEEAAKNPQYIPRITESKLHDIAWGLDVLDKRN